MFSKAEYPEVRRPLPECVVVFSYFQMAVDHRFESLGERTAGPDFFCGVAVSAIGKKGGGFVWLMYLRTSQCRWSASISRSNSRIEAWVWSMSPGKSFVPIATELAISGKRS